MNATILPFPGKPVFEPSPAQQRVFDFVGTGRGSAIVKAVAGAGKTTTIINALDRIPVRKPNGRDTGILYLAFNADIVKELKGRVPKHVSAKTFHSLGLGALGKHFGSAIFDRIDDKKMRKLAERHLNEVDHKLYASFAVKLVDLAKQAGVGCLEKDTLDFWYGLAEHYDVELEADGARIDHGIQHARDLLKESNAVAKHAIDYNDMVYLPVLLGLKFWQQDWIFVDEAQDLNATKRAIVRKALAPNGRVIAVGDPCQAINGFTGASSDSLDRIKRDFDCIELPLTVSYRCPQAVVRAAKTYVPYIEPAPSAPEGVVRSFNPNRDKFGPTDVVLCRNSAPLVDLAYGLIAQGVGCRILGREIGDGLVSLIDKMRAKGIDHLRDKLEAWRDREMEDAVAKGKEQKAAAIEDKVASIFTLLNRLPETKRTVPALKTEIKGMFDDSTKGLLTLCTAHKSKGKEWDRVFLLGSEELMPSKFARQKWQKEQESNLIYVAYTRAKRELIFMPLPDRDKNASKAA